MMQIPLPDGGVFAVIEPGNIQRLKEGKPLHVGNCLIAFTPDMERFMVLLGSSGELPKKGQLEVRELAKPVTPEQIQAALDETLKWPDVVR